MTGEMIKAIANDSKIRIDRIVDSYLELEQTNNTLLNVINNRGVEIAVLEKQNKELQEHHKKLCEEFTKENKRLLKENSELSARIEIVITENLELKKENAELKAEKGCETCTKFDEVKLTKAKKFLNEFMRIGKASDEDFEHDYSELIREAEQFLNSEVVK